MCTHDCRRDHNRTCLTFADGIPDSQVLISFRDDDDLQSFGTRRRCWSEVGFETTRNVELRDRCRVRQRDGRRDEFGKI